MVTVVAMAFMKMGMVVMMTTQHHDHVSMGCGGKACPRRRRGETTSCGWADVHDLGNIHSTTFVCRLDQAPNHLKARVIDGK